jgi:hypothetical protein
MSAAPLEDFEIEVKITLPPGILSLSDGYC